MAIKGKEMNKVGVMVLDLSIGTMDQVMKANGLRMFVMVMEFIDDRQAKNIVANGKMMFVTAKVNGLMRTEE